MKQELSFWSYLLVIVMAAMGGVFLWLGQNQGALFVLALGLGCLLLALAAVWLIRRELSKEQPRNYLPLLGSCVMVLFSPIWLYIGLDSGYRRMAVFGGLLLTLSGARLAWDLRKFRKNEKYEINQEQGSNS